MKTEPEIMICADRILLLAWEHYKLNSLLLGGVDLILLIAFERDQI